MKLIKDITIAVMLTSAALTAGLAQAHDTKAGHLTISHPWTPKPPPGAKVAAGFLKITNDGAALPLKDMRM